MMQPMVADRVPFSMASIRAWALVPFPEPNMEMVGM